MAPGGAIIREHLITNLLFERDSVERGTDVRWNRDLHEILKLGRREVLLQDMKGARK